MKVFIRKSLIGSEYWCTDEKRVLFIPAGQELELELEKVEVPSIEQPEDAINLEEMTADQLLEYAGQYGVVVPGNMKKEDTIRKFIADAMAVDVE